MPVRARGGHLPALLVFAFAAGSPVSAQVTYTVDSTLDQIDDDTSDGVCHTAGNTCTLRAAVMQANLIGGAGATIVLPAGNYLLTRPAQGPNGPDNGDLNLTTPAAGDPPISILGAGRASTIIDANQIDRVLSVASARSATISDVTLRNGFLLGTTSSGGAIFNQGVLALSRIEISGSVATGDFGYGGGISSGGELSITDGTVRGNRSEKDGGGVFAGKVLLTNCTLSENTSGGSGGAIYSDTNSSMLNMVNSTITLNTADTNGGGIYASAANIYSSTIVDNSADADADVNGGNGGGIFVLVRAGRTVNLSNTIVAGNTLFNQPIYDDCYGPLISYRRNLFHEFSGFCSITVNGGDGWDFLNSLALLGQLASNGGPTETISLLPGSNAIDYGDTTLGCTGPAGETLANDQRGSARSRGVRCDVGAYESGALFFDGFESGDVTAW
jgi:predicted outer membrane repeat protein